MTDLSPISAQISAQLPEIPPDRPVLIAGPTASGKSALALHLARTSGGVIVNADALQVFAGWHILTARPSQDDLLTAPHALYGHISPAADYSVGHWLREVAPLLDGPRPIIVGGTGLYFHALTKGLAEIPPTPSGLRHKADAMEREAMLAALDPATASQIDTLNRARVQRAWEVQQATGRSIVDWQAATPPPLLPLADAVPLVMMPDPDWLNHRIEARFDLMLKDGLLGEAAAMQATWDPAALSSKAIGAPELIAHLQGDMSLDEAREAVIIATRQYGKRQRTWFRSRMKDWFRIGLGA